MKKNSCTPINPKKIFMLWPKKNSYKQFDNKNKFLRLENSPPPPYNFSNGPSLSTHTYDFLSAYHKTLLLQKLWQDLPLTERFHLQICLVFQRVSALTRVSHVLESRLVDSWICLDSRSATASTALPCLLLLTYKKKTCQPKVFLLMYRTYNLFKEKVSGFLVVYFVDYTNFNESLRMQPLELNRHRP